MKSFSKKILFVILILCCSYSFAQQKIDIKYYINNTESSIEEVKVFLVTNTDTIAPKIEKGKIQLPKKFKENFSLFAQINGRTFKIGSYRAVTFNEIDAIVFGRITDFSIMKPHWEKRDSFFIDNQYVVIIPNPESIADVIYCSVKNDVNVSGHSNFIAYSPRFDTSYEVIQKK